MELSVLLSQAVQQGGKHQTQTVAEWMVQGERLTAENPHLKELGWGGGGGGLDLTVNVNYLDKIRSF